MPSNCLLLVVKSAWLVHTRDPSAYYMSGIFFQHHFEVSPHHRFLYVHRKKQTHAEQLRLGMIQEELQKLDQRLSCDVSIIRNQIEAASLEFMEAQLVISVEVLFFLVSFILLELI